MMVLQVWHGIAQHKCGSRIRTQLGTPYGALGAWPLVNSLVSLAAGIGMDEKAKGWAKSFPERHGIDYTKWPNSRLQTSI